MEPHEKEFNVYKGLQKPLVFKGFKGKYIYWGFGAMIGGLILCIVITTISSFLFGGLTLFLGVFGGIGCVAFMQKGGIYKKDKKECIYIFKNLFTNGKFN